MTISPGERTLYAFFNNRVAARRAAEALNTDGFELPFVDRLDRHEGTDFLTNSTLYPDGYDTHSGAQLGDVDFDRGFFFTLKTTDDRVNKAIEIVRKHEGYI